MQTRLSYRGIPVTGTLLRNSFNELQAPKAKIERLVKSGDLIRLRRNLYIDTDTDVMNSFLAANYIVSPSYVSGLTALCYYGIIPETVVDTISMTTVKKAIYNNKIGNFTYHQLPSEYFYLGIQEKNILGSNVLIASMEKALCDHIQITPNLNLRFIQETRSWLEDEMRMDMEELSKMNLTLLSECAQKGKKKRMLNNIIKIFS